MPYDPLYDTNAVPSPSDTGTTNADTTSSGITSAVSSFDEFTQFGISPNMENMQVPFTLKHIGPWGENIPGQTEGDASEAAGNYVVQRDPKSYLDATRFLAGINTAAPDQFKQIQLSLVAGGFAGKNPNIIPGAYDATTRKAWNEVLLEAMRTGKTPDEIMSGAVDANGGLDAGLSRFGMGSNAVSPIRLTHPDDIRAVAKQVSMKVLGKSWNSDQIEQFVKTYQGMETGEGQAARGQVGGSYTAAPSLDAEVEAQARRQNPAAAGATDWDNAFQGITKAIKTLSSGGA